MDGDLSVEVIREAFEYRDGILFWKSGRNRQRAGYIYANGYYGVYHHGKILMQHRIIFALFNGRWPKNHIDHIDGDPGNNLIENLREATYTQNHQNRKKSQKSKQSQYKGVCRKRDKWRATIVVDRKQISLGSFFSEIDAARAYNKAALEHFGEFARINKGVL